MLLSGDFIQKGLSNVWNKKKRTINSPEVFKYLKNEQHLQSLFIVVNKLFSLVCVVVKKVNAFLTVLLFWWPAGSSCL